jgi:hypothetical protein
MDSTWERLQYERRLGRNDLPALLDELADSGDLDDLDELAYALEDAWTMADLPTIALPRRRWVELFRRVGFLVDARRDESARPTERMKLYRAATAHDRRTPGLAWSASLDQARFFVEYNRRYLPRPIILFTATVAPYQMLARFHESRSEDEYIVNVSNRSIKPAHES